MVWVSVHLQCKAVITVSSLTPVMFSDYKVLCYNMLISDAILEACYRLLLQAYLLHFPPKFTENDPDF